LALAVALCLKKRKKEKEEDATSFNLGMSPWNKEADNLLEVHRFTFLR